jgi:SAM-dependent methyltransferase
MTQAEVPPQLALFRMATAYYVSRALHAATVLGIPDLLADTTRDADDLAKATGTHASSLARALRLLVSAGVLTEHDDGRFALTPLGGYLRAGVPGSMRAATLLFTGRTQDTWRELLHCLRTGEPAFARLWGADPFTFLAQHPDEAALFDEAMADWTVQVATATAAAYDFSRFGTIVDVGGGNGSLLAGIMGAFPGPRGILFDRPDVAERARIRLETLGLSKRCVAIGGDFFRDVPAGGDVYLLKHVLHDWDDERAAAILASCHRAMTPAARLLVVEGVYPRRIDQSEASRGAAANDVNMLVCTGGRQRSEAEFRHLFAAAGFELARIVPTQLGVCVIEGAQRAAAGRAATVGV